MPDTVRPSLDLTKPRYDQSTYFGRARHYFDVCDPRTVFATNKQLDEARKVVTDYKRDGKLPDQMTEEQLWNAKKLYDSAFHPQNGQKLFLFGRMSFQVPGNMLIVGCMLTWYKTTPAVIFWQWINQTFNATVNYTNRNSSTETSNKQLGQAYLAASSCSVAVAVGLNKIIEKIPALRTGIVGRFVPMLALSAANCVNIPLMRQRELAKGIDVLDEDDQVVGKSRLAAKSAVMQVVISRIAMAAPSALLPPIIMSKMERVFPFLKNPRIQAPFMVLLVGVNLVVSTPLACALFPQKSSISVSRLEPELRTLKRQDGSPVQRLSFNKGL